MKPCNRQVILPGFWLFFLVVLLLIGAAMLLEVSPEALAAGSDSAAATYSRGILHVSIPYHTAHNGPGQLSVEVLSPEDEILGRLERSIQLDEKNGYWHESITLTKTLTLDELVWHRLRYHFAYSDSKAAPIEGAESISEILRTPVIHVLGQQSYLSGGQAAVRLIVTDSKNEAIAGPGTVKIDLPAPGQKSRLLFTGSLDRRGTTEAQFRLPVELTGTYPLHYVVDTAIGSAEYTQQVHLASKASMLLTTEKPIYQPGQTIHARALALDRASHEAVANRNLTFEVEDSRGNKVFRKTTRTDKFGVAAAEFTLADEVNLGTYHLRALMDEADSVNRNTAELALNVERYVLPKFKVAVEFAGKDNEVRHGYRPGDHVTGTVRANYFFGKPVDSAEITVKASGMDVAMFDAGSAQGRTDNDGSYHFDFKLPTYFAGRPLNQGAARVLVEATVKDSAGHSESRGEPITVSQSPLLVTAVPEGGTLVPNLDNQVFILTSYADGKPAVTDITAHVPEVADLTATTDDAGVAVVPLRADAGLQSLQIEARDRHGNHISATVPLQSRNGSDQILLRTERAVYRAGDRIVLRVFSTRERGAAYIDVIKEGQTVLTRDVDIVNGQAELALTATPSLAGTLDFNAYLFGRDARPVADHRLVFVQPADELKVEATADAQVYKPGDDARIRFRVTNGKGEGVQAALGLQVVDEAVFALAEKQPGFAKVFFYLEQEVMKPRYEIHSFGMPEIITTAGKAGQQDRAARALFAATEMVNTNKFETEFGRTVPQTKFAEYYQRYQSQFAAQVRKLEPALTNVYRQTGDLIQVSGPEFHDPWGNELRVERINWVPQGTYYLVRSAGADKRLYTADDLVATVEVRKGGSVGKPGTGSVEVEIEHDRGPFNGLAEIAGSVKDQTGAAVLDATIKARDIATGKVRTARPNAGGQFSLSGLPAGTYQVEVSSAGFQIASHEVSLKVRDRAVLTATLKVDSVAQSIVVAENMGFGSGGGIGAGHGGGVGGGKFMLGGVAGGVLGGIAVNGAPSPPPPQFAVPLAKITARTAALAVDEPAPSAPRVRSYFPEALYINPEIITDQTGSATISIPLADSITTWRMAMMASTPHGALGSGTSSLKVFQDFFVDLDLPVTLTQGDRVSLPVAVYNYSGAAGDVSLQLQPADWFRLVDDVPAKSVAVDSGRVGGSQFSLEATRIGKFKLTLNARLKDRADIVVREIEVVPNGREQNIVFNGRLETSMRHELSFPSAAIPEAGKIFVRLYPGPLSQVIEGMDSLLRMPFGCFEQTSSATYPNVLALDYMKRTKKLTPEVHAKAEGFITNGYQRLLTFEVPGGGFSWFGQAPANKILTSYGLMEFFDMSQVHDVDPKVIQRTQQWLAAQQQADGSWKPDTSFINEGATNRYNSDLLRITAYVAWALENTGYQGPAVEKARQYVEQHMDSKLDAYTLAVLANFVADYAKDREFTRRAVGLLLDARTEKDDKVWWDAQETGVYASGASAAVETTGLAVQALLKSGEASATAGKALNFIAANKDASGAWRTTQATIMALRALLLSTEKGAADVRGTVEISLNGKPVQSLTLTADNNDLLHQFVFPVPDAAGANAVDLRFTGKGGLAYQVVGRYFIPWTEKPASEPLSIDVAYDRTQLAQDDIATATATVRNNLTKAANMVMVDLGIPPGFDLLNEDLQDYQEKTAGRKGGRLEKFNLTATQAILYFDSIPPRDTVTLRFRLRAKYPIRARTFPSRAYEYYDPEVDSVARPVQLEVHK